VELAPTDLTDVVTGSAELLRPQAERAGLDLSIEISSHLPHVAADPGRIRQVITNLVHNAIKFTPAGGQVYVSAAASASEVIVSVRDTGVGIPREDLPRIFERFYKADRARSGGGTGLGLAISKHIIQAHSGRIWVDSTEGSGSTFYFALRVLTRR
jgi:two-component system, OmpR family, phosphate regulon sensor histidine kinase PhoR